MPEEPQQNKDGLIAIYQQICTSYQENVDFRAKLLGFLPLATGGGIFLLLNTLTDETKHYMFPVGVFGFAITLGLFSYEIHGILRGNLLIISGNKIERELGIKGQFYAWPLGVQIPFAASVIYPAVLAAWTFFAFVFTWPRISLWAAFVVFIVGFTWTILYTRWINRRLSTSILREET